MASIAVNPAVPMRIESRVDSASGSFTSHSDFTRARSEYPPHHASPTRQPVRTTRSPGEKSVLADSTTVPARSTPGMCGYVRTRRPIPRRIIPSL